MASLASKVLFGFPVVRFQAVPPNRDSRHGSTPKPRKEKEKSYDCCCAILMVHLFDPSFLCSPRYCVRAGARLREKWLSVLKDPVLHRRYRREGAHASAPSLHCMNLLRTNYSDEMAQFVFDIAGHRNGVGYFLAQQRLVTLTETVERLLYRVLGHAEFGRDLGL